MKTKNIILIKLLIFFIKFIEKNSKKITKIKNSKLVFISLFIKVGFWYLLSFPLVF